MYYYTAAQIAQFSLTPAFGVGNAGRNIFHNPWFNELDLSLIKSFKITERQKITFRAEAYNAFNHPNFGFTSTNLNIPHAGQLSAESSARRWVPRERGRLPARTMQVALRYDF